MNIKDQVIVITGGLGLIGSSFVKAIENNGGIAIAADINALEYNLNITDSKSINNLIEDVFKKYGKIDAVVNNAYPRNKNYGQKFEDVNYNDFAENISMNLGGYFLVSKLFTEIFKKQGYGNIINIASVYGIVAPKFKVYEKTKMTMPVEYSVIKSGLIHLTKYMAKYLKGQKIRVNAISPGGVIDKQSEIFIEKYNEECLNKGLLDTKDLIGSLLFLLSDDSKFINGQNIIVDDGFTL